MVLLSPKINLYIWRIAMNMNEIRAKAESLRLNPHGPPGHKEGMKMQTCVRVQEGYFHTKCAVFPVLRILPPEFCISC